MKQPTSVRRIELVTRFSDDNGNKIISMDEICKAIKEHSKAIQDYAYIVHDKCTKLVKNDNGTETEVPIAPHIHLCMRFTTPQHIPQLSGWFGGLPESCFEKIKGNWADSLLYLIHGNNSQKRKYQYSVSEVIANFDYEKEIELAKNKANITLILQKIVDGDIRNITEIDGLVYIRNAKQINEAFKYRHSVLTKQIDRNLEVIMITGSSGSGKTTLAKRICKEKGLDVFVSSSSNDPFYGYKNNLAKAVILDDLRPSIMSLSDLLKTIDNHINSSVRSRHHNVSLNCELIIITTVLNIDEFFRQVFENEQEPSIQFKRRIGTYIVMNKHTISIQKWDDVNMCYSDRVTYINDTLVEFEAEKIANTKTPKEQIEELLPFLSGKEIPTPKHYATKTKDKQENTEIITDEDFINLLSVD